MAKKINKVETPIDQKETFVSLQKNFVDADSSVQEKLKVLYELQDADVAIDKILQLRGELPEEVEALEAEIASLNSKIEANTELVEKFATSITSHKENIEELDAEIAKYQKQLENIANSREYDSINKEIENQGYLKLISEKNINETKAAIAAKKAETEEIRETLALREEDLKAKREELDTIVESTSAEEKRLLDKRNDCASKIDERTMSAYNRIRNSVVNRLAIVSVYNGDSCGGCFNTITPQRLLEIATNKKLIICEHCGRIIVNPEFEQ